MFFNVDRSRPCRWVQAWLPLLEKALGYAGVLPKRRISTVEEFLKHFPEVKDLLIDGTERPTQKPGSGKNRRRRYSGKKRQPTRKSLVGTSYEREILLLSPTKNDRRHDKWRLDQTDWVRHRPRSVRLWVDTGFMGIEVAGHEVERPVKRSKQVPLTPDQKQNNRFISCIRIRVEHAIAGMKRFQSATHIYRHRLGQDDRFM